MLADPIDRITDGLRMIGHDEKRLLLIAGIEHAQHLRGSILKNNGIQRLVKAEQNPGDHDDHNIESENEIPCVHALFLGEKNRDKIRSARGRIHGQTETGHKAVDDPAENADQQNVVCQRYRRYGVRHDTGENDHQAGIQRKFLSDKPESDIDRHDIQQQIDRRIRDKNAEIHFENALYQYGQPRSAARIQAACIDKGFDIHRHDSRCKADNDDPSAVFLKVKSHIRYLRSAPQLLIGHSAEFI